MAIYNSQNEKVSAGVFLGIDRRLRIGRGPLARTCEKKKYRLPVESWRRKREPYGSKKMKHANEDSQGTIPNEILTSP
jgi:hypothetical protein